MVIDKAVTNWGPYLTFVASVMVIVFVPIGGYMMSSIVDVTARMDRLEVRVENNEKQLQKLPPEWLQGRIKHNSVLLDRILTTATDLQMLVVRTSERLNRHMDALHRHHTSTVPFGDIQHEK